MVKVSCNRPIGPEYGAHIELPICFATKSLTCVVVFHHAYHNKSSKYMYILSLRKPCKLTILSIQAASEGKEKGP